MKNESQNRNHCDTFGRFFVAVIGRPNVGKSSLTNLLVGEKVAIVTSKPQDYPHPHHRRHHPRTSCSMCCWIPPVCTRHIISWENGWTRPPATPSLMSDVSMMLFEPYGALNGPEMVVGGGAKEERWSGHCGHQQD